MSQKSGHKVLEDGHFKLISCDNGKDSKTFTKGIVFDIFGIGKNHAFEGERALEKRKLRNCIRCDIRNVLSVRIITDDDEYL